MELIHETERIYLPGPDGTLLAEITFPIQNGVATINHTFVAESLRGQHIADQLVREAVSQLTEQSVKARATCSYAVRWFSEHPLLVEPLLETTR